MKKYWLLLRHKKAYKHSQSGFALFETLCVLALCAFLFLLSVPLVGLYRQHMVEYELNRLYAVVLFMQRKACLTNEPQFLTFDSDGKGYTADVHHALAPGVVFDVMKEVKGPPSAPTHVLKEAVTFSGNKIMFNPTRFYSYNQSDNVAISAGSVYLTTCDRSVLYALTCDASESSRIRLYRYADGWKLLD